MAKTDKIDSLMYHYNRVRQDMDTRRTRKNGWNDIVSAYMGKLPANWPYLSVVTDPRIRTTVLEKTARLLNAKLQGRVVPREGSDVIKARIQNSLLDYNWDAATDGGSMIEKIASADQTARLFGAAFTLSYWNVEKNINEIKNIDVRDIGFDGSATHVRNARWVQVREFTTWDKLAERGYNVKKLKAMAEKGEVTSQWRSSSYESQVKANRGLQDRVGEYDDPKNPVLEIITEWSPKAMTIFLPRYGLVVDDRPNPYKHGNIPISMLRYYPLGDDIYGESEVESVLPIQRAINAILCGFVDEMNIAMRPPLKIASSGVRIETIQYGPGAQWLMQNPNMVQEMQFSPQVISNFNATYPALVAAFNSAMGDQSMGISASRSAYDKKTATEVRSMDRQQNNRDQYNQLYLSEYLKDMMMMWLSNFKQYLFDDETKQYHIVKVIGKDNIKLLKQMHLDNDDIPDDAVRQIADAIKANPSGITAEQIAQIGGDISVPTNPIITNPEERNPENYTITRKLSVADNGEEAELYVEKGDFEGTVDYIPDVQSMAAGANENVKQSREKALALAFNPQVNQALMAEGYKLKVKELLASSLTDGGYRDADGLFEKYEPDTTGPSALGPGGMPSGVPQLQGVPNASQAVPPAASPGGISGPEGLR